MPFPHRKKQQAPEGMSRQMATLVRARLPLWQHDPGQFAWDVFGLHTWDRQEDLLQAIATNQKVSVVAGHKVSKSCSAAITALWWWTTRRRARVLITAPSYRQVWGVIWKEIRSLYRRAEERGIPLGGEIHLSPEKGLQSEDGREIVGFTASDPKKVDGFSGENIFVIVDEACGVKEEIFEALEGVRAGGASMLLISNPTTTSGTFYKSQTPKERKNTDNPFGWCQLKISSIESPNVRQRRVVIPGLATWEYVEEKRLTWGETSPLFQIRIKGEFAAQNEMSVVGLGLITQATQGWDANEQGQGRLHIGVDVARFGSDETVIISRRGLKAEKPIALKGKDTVEVCNQVMSIARQLKKRDEQPIVKVDDIGVGGGVFDQLKRNLEIEAVAVTSSRSADNNDYANLRAQLAFGVADWIKAGGTFPEDSKLEEELAAPEYKFNSRGQFQVESKDDIKAKIERSPDRADALALAIYEGRTARPVSYGNWNADDREYRLL